MGAPPPNPLENKNKRFKPSLLSAFREQQRGKEKRKEWGLFAPTPPTRNNVPGPDQWAHRTPDTTQAGDTPAARKHPGPLPFNDNLKQNAREPDRQFRPQGKYGQHHDLYRDERYDAAINLHRRYARRSDAA